MKNYYFLCILFCVTSLHAQQSIIQYQYWFDNDYTNAQTLTASGNEFNSQISTASLNTGLHTYHFRTKQSNGLWSSVISQKFNKTTNIIAYEYWFNNDYGNKINIALSATDHLNINDLINTSSLSYEEHRIHFKTKDQSGKWSSITSQSFVKTPKIDAYEYWFDEDFANKISTTLNSPVSQLNIDQLISLNSLMSTHHTIHYRCHQQNGKWSVVQSQKITSENKIVAYEYWFNDDYNNKTFQAIVASNEYELSPQINVSSSPLGSNQLYIRFQDKNGKWGQILSDGFCHNTGDSSIHLKIFLEGYYTGGGIMNSVLLNEGISNDPLVADTIEVALHNALPPHQVVASTRAILQVDGDAKVDFPFNYVGNYYLSIKHRNTLETWTATPIFRGNCPVLYDFTTQANKAYGSNMKELENGIWGFYTGDNNQDENIDLIDASIVESDVNNFLFGYYLTDLNGDGNVDLLDNPIVETNVNEFVFVIRP